jgi:hypothetical protein
MSNYLEAVNSLLSRFNIDYFFGQPSDTITLWFLVGFLTVFSLFVVIYSLLLRLKSKSIKPYGSYVKTFFWYNLTFATIGYIHLFGRYENLAMISWRFWMYLLLAIMLAFNGWFFSKRRQDLEDEIEKFMNKARKDKWIKKSKK